MLTVDHIYDMNETQKSLVFKYLKKIILEDALINQKMVFGQVSANVLKIQGLIRDSVFLVDRAKEDGVVELNNEMLGKLREAYKYAGESFDGVSKKLAVNYENIIYEIRDRGEIVDSLVENDVFVCTFRLGIGNNNGGKIDTDMCLELLGYINDNVYNGNTGKVFFEDVSMREGRKDLCLVEFLFCENIFTKIDSRKFLSKIRDVFGNSSDVVTSDHTLKPFMPLMGNDIDSLVSQLVP